MDDYETRIMLHPGTADDLAYAGWEVADGASLEGLVDRLRRAGKSVREAGPVEASLRAVDRFFVTEDPSGTRVELYCGPAMANRPFHSPQGVTFATGEGGLGHMVVCVPSLAEGERFYCELLGLRLSDYIRAMIGGTLPVEIAFLRANARHHTLAFAALQMPRRVHHLMLEVQSLDDVGRALDRCVATGAIVTRGLGRHPNDRMFSFYVQTPSGFEVEYGWGGRVAEDASWTIRSYGQMSEWGHHPPGA
jgi:biphenyl-2,3-diol 1,2-dioxygenase/3,4-dihydroxy-9,10-secoandrosta-1,3,5(10)-triene-9,17-dione 4,5-dioxygenase